MEYLQILLSCFAVLALLLPVILLLWKVHIKRWSHIPIGKGCLPIIGHMHLMLKNAKSTEAFVQWIYEYAELNGPTYVFFFLWHPTIFSIDVNFGKALLSSQKYIRKTKQIDMLKEWLGVSLLTGTGKLWKERRRLITPAFHLDILSSNIPILEEQTLHMVKHIKECSENGATLKFAPVCRLFALGAICEFAMGVPMKLCTKNPEASAKRFSEASEDLLLSLNKRFVNPLYKSEWIFRQTKLGKKYYSNLDIFNSFVKSVVEERINIHNQSTSEKPKIFIDILLDAYQKGEIDIQGMMHEVNGFIFAGNETISITLAWVIFHLGKRMDIQEKLYNEFKNYKERNLEIKDILKEAVYLDCVIKEIQRMTNMSSFARHIEEDANINDIFVPAGTEIILQAHNIHLSKDNWKEPESFRPERFQEEGAEEYNFKFLPFSAGPRNCIGKRFAISELKIAVYQIILNFKIEIAKEIENSHRFAVFVDKETEFKFTPRDIQ